MAKPMSLVLWIDGARAAEGPAGAPRDTAATRLSLHEGEAAELANETGRLVVYVQTAEVVRPGVALSYKGRWPKHERTHANVNVLNPGTKTDMGESTSIHAVEIMVTPVRT